MGTGKPGLLAKVLTFGETLDVSWTKSLSDAFSRCFSSSDSGNRSNTMTRSYCARTRRKRTLAPFSRRAICSSTVVVTVMSREPLASVRELKQESPCDNVVLEYWLALSPVWRHKGWLEVAWCG